MKAKPLTDESVRLIRRLLALRMSPTKVSKRLRISARVVMDIAAGRSYQHVLVQDTKITPDDIRASGRWDRIFPWALHVPDHVAGLGVDRLDGKRTWLPRDSGRGAEIAGRVHPY